PDAPEAVDAESHGGRGKRKQRREGVAAEGAMATLRGESESAVCKRPPVQQRSRRRGGWKRSRAPSSCNIGKNFGETGLPGPVFARHLWKRAARAACWQLLPRGPSRGLRGPFLSSLPASSHEMASVFDTSSRSERKQQRQKIDQARQKVQQLRQRYFGPEQGQLYQRQKKLMRPIQERVLAAVETIAEGEGYDYVVDKSGPALFMYTNEEYNLTDDVLEELGIDVEGEGGQTASSSSSAGERR
ncbi:MAG: hypothetical protein BRD30_02710, partial [Bacteroidetes bacterium QH_2_63_10]